ncbi:hypothetical protein D3C84_1072690 [compost metagenome]
MSVVVLCLAGLPEKVMIPMISMTTSAFVWIGLRHGLMGIASDFTTGNMMSRNLSPRSTTRRLS